MRLLAKIGGWRPVGAGVAVLGLLAFSGTPMAQTAQQKAAPQAQPRPAQPIQPNWVVTCANGQKGMNCQATQTLRLQKVGRANITVAVRIPADTKKPVMLVQLPLGLYLPAGVSIQFGPDTGKVMPYEGCTTNGCIVEYPITDAELNSLIQGAELTVLIQTASKQPVKLQVPTTGFATAYAKIK